MIKLLTVVGARPQFIKASVLRRAFQTTPEIEEVLLHTGQHYDQKMSDIFFDELEIHPPDISQPRPTGGHGAATGKMLASIEEALLEQKPDAVLVYGDTNSTLAGALAAAKLHIPVVHVEAGLRSFDRRMPEETNRVLTDHLSELLFSPTRTASQNLFNEGLKKNVHTVGDIMYDAALFAMKKSVDLPRVGGVDLSRPDIALVTIHRAENTDDPSRLRRIIEYINSNANDYSLVMPMHPRTKNAIESHGINLDKIHPIDPVGYFEFQALLSSSQIVYTDSGGVQKEAYFAKVPCVTLRDNTEWTELIEAGWNRLWTSSDFEPRSEVNEYGKGNTAELIIDHIIAHFG